MKNWGEPGIFYSCAWHTCNWQLAWIFRTKRQCVAHCSNNFTLNAWCVWPCMCSKLPGICTFPFARLIVNAFPVHSHAPTCMSFLPPFYPWYHSCQKKSSHLHDYDVHNPDPGPHMLPDLEVFVSLAPTCCLTWKSLSVWLPHAVWLGNPCQSGPPMLSDLENHCQSGSHMLPDWENLCQSGLCMLGNFCHSASVHVSPLACSHIPAFIP